MIQPAHFAGAVAPVTQTQDVDELIYLISHDVRASARALLELPQWIAEDLQEAGVEVSGPVAQSFEMMNRHAARLDRMLVDLLAYARVGRMQDAVSIDLGDLLDEVLAQMRMPEAMRLSRDLQGAQLLMGPRDAHQMLAALIGNAVKHHGAARGMISLRARAEGEMIALRICDDGQGIPEEMHAKALGVLTTLRPRDEVEGTGMGLAHVGKIVAHYGGSLALSKSALGGLQVDLYVPRGA